MSSLNWQVESLRFSFINTEEGNPHSDFKWSSITSTEPDTVTSKPSLGLFTEVGPWMGNNLTVSRQGGRTDVLLSVPEPEFGLDGLVRFETFLEIVSEMICGFSALASHRLAFGGVLMLPVESVKAGYEMLQTFLPFVRFEEDMSDFFLQLNRKRGEGEARVNELAKWSCLSFRRLVVAGDSVGQLEFDSHAVRMEFDINNPGLEQAVSGHEIINRLQDFINRAKRIASEGAA